MRITRIFTLLGLIFFNCSGLYSQQLPSFSQFYINDAIINPGNTGYATRNPIWISNRKEWVGLSSSPNTLTASGNFKLSRLMGLGFNIYKDATGGAITRSGVAINYAYHVRFTKDFNMSLGLSGVVNQFGFDNSKVKTLYQNDPLMPLNLQKAITPDANAGIMFRYKNAFKIGLASHQLLESPLQELDSSHQSNRLARHFYFTTAFSFSIDSAIKIEPSVVLRKTEISDLALDLNLKLKFGKAFWIAASYRPSHSLVGLVGFNLKNFNVGYSYDYYITSNIPYTSASQEIFLGYFIKSKVKNEKTRNPVKEKPVVIEKKKLEAPKVEPNEEPKKEKKEELVTLQPEKVILEKPKENISENVQEPQVTSFKNTQLKEEKVESTSTSFRNTANSNEVQDNNPTSYRNAPPLENSNETSTLIFKTPDTDNDNVVDTADRCPNTKGDSENHGCPVISDSQNQLLKQLVRDLRFDGTRISDESDRDISKLSKLLNVNGDWNVKITCNISGFDASNVELSHKKAESVRNRLIALGLDQERVFIEYYGVENSKLNSSNSENTIPAFNIEYIFN